MANEKLTSGGLMAIAYQITYKDFKSETAHNRPALAV